jgi:nucleotide-binding universal stress UspA family protein
MLRQLAAVGAGRLDYLLLYVIDTGPRHEWEKHLKGPLRHRPPREAKVMGVEESAGQAALQEALATAQQLGFTAEVMLKQGKPEQVIVQVARDVAASLIVISAREGAAGHPRLGPASVGHTARFVLDHAPCHVLLLRESP